MHTPGPWTACHDGECSCKIVSCAHYPVARVTVGKWGDDYPAIRLVGSSSLDMKAEAFMEQTSPMAKYPRKRRQQMRAWIAAAPKMLAALQEIEEFLDNQADVDDGRPPNDAMRLFGRVA